MGFFLLVAAGNDSTKATFTSGMKALMEDDEQRRLVLADSTLMSGAVEESLRMFPAFAHFRRTAMRDAELGGEQIRKGDKVVLWYVASNRDERRYDDPTSSMSAARPSIRRSVPAVVTSASGRHSRAWSCGSCSRRRSRGSADRVSTTTRMPTAGTEAVATSSPPSSTS